jgi:DNA polymerase I
MKCRFFLLDLNEDSTERVPTLRLWGIDDKGKRILIKTTQIAPYFYVLANEDDSPQSIQNRLLSDKNRFPKITAVEIQKKKVLGRERDVLKIVCSDSQALTSYARNLRKWLGKGETSEADLRLPVRYITDTDLTPSAWNEIEVEPTEPNGASVDRAFAARGVAQSVRDDAVPALRILAFDTVIVGERGSARPERDPVRAIATATNQGTSGNYLAEGTDDSVLLARFAQEVRTFDPDMIVGFEINTVRWPYLIQRYRLRKLKLALGKDASEPHSSAYGHVSVAGRANVDLFDVAGGMPEVKVKTIESLAEFLRIPSAGQVPTIDESDLLELWKNEAGRKRLIENSRTNARALLELAEATLDYQIQLSALTGLPLDQAMAAAVGFRVDSYLIKQAHRIGEVIPSRVEQPYYTYRGALVLEPKHGVHENIAVLDFASMYPRLMEKYNLSPDTLIRPSERVANDLAFAIPEVKHRFRKKPDGFYRIVLLTLIQQRDAIKKGLTRLEEQSTQYKVLRERERAVKIITNACYGYAAWAGARWYSKEVAESATALGRETINKTIAKAESLGLSVIYGDTDSIFVKDDRAKVQRLQEWADKEFGLDIRREKQYVRVLFTEAMKRYAGLLHDESLDIVGLEVVRSDWSDIARKVQEQVLKSILRDQSTDKAIEHVQAMIRSLKAGEVPLDDLTIRKALTKPIEDYAVRTPHVEVAKLLVKQGWDLGVGDKVAYVIVKGPGKLFQKAKPSNMVKPGEVDVDFYLDNQVKPAAMRVLELFGVNEKQLNV